MNIPDHKLALLTDALERMIRETFTHVTFTDVRISAKETYLGDDMKIEIVAFYEGDMEQLHGPERPGILVRLQDAIWEEGVDAFPSLFFTPAPESRTARA